MTDEKTNVGVSYFPRKLLTRNVLQLLIFFAAYLLLTNIMKMESITYYYQRSAFKLHETRDLTTPNQTKCSPRHNIMYVKTQKCGSSTVQSIFINYGYNHNLTFALPVKLNMLGYSVPFEPNQIPEDLTPPGGKINIFAAHTRLRLEEHRKVLHEDALWVTILREPASQFESMYNYFKLKRFYKIDFNSIKNMPNISLPRIKDFVGPNQMTWVMGYSDKISGEALRTAIDTLDGLFDLVMIKEHMDESLVLLRHLLCWDVRDLVTFDKKARSTRTEMDGEMKRILRELNSADVKLYEHFLEKHRREVMNFGTERMAKEVEELKKVRAEYTSECEALITAGDKSNTTRVHALGITAESCNLSTLREYRQFDILRNWQRKMLQGA